MDEQTKNKLLEINNFGISKGDFTDDEKTMSSTVFNQYKKIADEFCKLFRMAGTRYLDTIQSTMTDEQYNKIKTHPCFDNVYI